MALARDGSPMSNCGNPPTSSLPESVSNESPVAQPRPDRSFTRVKVELSCLMCGRDFGVLECETWPVYERVVLRESPRRKSLIADWRRLRCAVCGGAAMPGEITHRLVRVEAPIDWSQPARRGRPPRSVAAQRESDGGSA